MHVGSGAVLVYVTVVIHSKESSQYAPRASAAARPKTEMLHAPAPRTAQNHERAVDNLQISQDAQSHEKVVDYQKSSEDAPRTSAATHLEQREGRLRTEF